MINQALGLEVSDVATWLRSWVIPLKTLELMTEITRAYRQAALLLAQIRLDANTFDGGSF